MLFNSLQFALFLALVLAARAIARGRAREAVLLASGLLFYSLWTPVHLALLLGLLAASWLLLGRIERAERPRPFLVLQVVLSLGVLAVVKYSGLAAEVAAPLFRALGRAAPRVPELALPLGISFYTFEIVSLAVDVARRKQPRPSFARYALFVTFFPHLIAGPIMRGSELLPQLEAGGRVTPERVRRGLWLFAAGLVKKTVLSDFLLMPFVDEVFGLPGVNPGPVHWVAAYSFAFQIYLDFSGYTDMARGIACLLGFELPMNFAEPYLSRDPSELWRRWHVTLSRWLRDYLYVPLGGNRHGTARTLVNLMITMVLGGLWHGAGACFLLWGALHGVLLVAYRLLGSCEVGAGEPGLRDAPRILLLFHLVCLAWVPFRSATLADAGAFYRALLVGDFVRDWPLVPLAAVLACGVLHVVERRVRLRLPALRARVAVAPWGPALEGAALGAALAAATLASGGGVQFIYFQF